MQNRISTPETIESSQESTPSSSVGLTFATAEMLTFPDINLDTTPSPQAEAVTKSRGGTVEYPETVVYNKARIVPLGVIIYTRNGRQRKTQGAGIILRLGRAQQAQRHILRSSHHAPLSKLFSEIQMPDER
ncbi:hypothetical protein AJ79_01140 [Helicocarpus griseus UAMH5409]|uniref:Uncharacterized protein n=1 Tax=Helicocarpus griseus UAMH5409 TaxID=1447875 RepID=A0A2B7Y8L2_9EURO|nr:hypothetical protein AJ79_01140 [Helicocarpus griseus UAMH5409]